MTKWSTRLITGTREDVDREAFILGLKGWEPVSIAYEPTAPHAIERLTLLMRMREEEGDTGLNNIGSRLAPSSKDTT